MYKKFYILIITISIFITGCGDTVVLPYNNDEINTGKGKVLKIEIRDLQSKNTIEKYHILSLDDYLYHVPRFKVGSKDEKVILSKIEVGDELDSTYFGKRKLFMHIIKKKIDNYKTKYICISGKKVSPYCVEYNNLNKNEKEFLAY